MGKIPRLHRPELLLAKNFFSSLSPSAGAGGAKEPGHLHTRHSEVEPDSSGSGGGGGELSPRLAWMVTWECNCMMMMKKARKSCRPGWLGWSPGSATGSATA